MQLLIDGYKADHEVLISEMSVTSLLDTLPGWLGLTKISEPMVKTYHGPVAEDWGVSGFVMIAESHIAVHTYPERGAVFIDVFSCRDFDADDVLVVLKDAFLIGEEQHWVIRRGL